MRNMKLNDAVPSAAGHAYNAQQPQVLSTLGGGVHTRSLAFFKLWERADR